jgi:SPP1 family holin
MNITKSTIVRTVMLAVAIINAGLQLMGKSPLPIDNELVEEAVSLAFLIGTSIAAWWKNNSFTLAARYGDDTMKSIKRKKKNG